MPPRRGRNLPGADKTFLDDPELVLIRPLPTANAIGRGENFDLRAVNEIGHKARLIIGSKPTSDGPRRSLTKKPRKFQTKVSPVNPGQFSFMQAEVRNLRGGLL